MTKIPVPILVVKWWITWYIIQGIHSLELKGRISHVTLTPLISSFNTNAYKPCYLKIPLLVDIWNWQLRIKTGWDLKFKLIPITLELHFPKKNNPK